MQMIKRKLLILFLFCVMFATVWAADTGDTICTTGASSVWANPTNITANNNTYSTNANADEALLIGSVYGFTIPGDATIDSITMTIESRHSGGGPAGEGQGYYGPSKNGTSFAGDSALYQGVNNSNVTHVDDGGLGNLWGTTWTVTEANAIQTLVHKNGTGTRTHQIDYHQIKISYTEAGGGGVGQVIMING